jgi:hypothetical protein
LTGEVDPDLKLFMRQRMVLLAEYREVLTHGTDEERQALVASLREIDLIPLASTLDEPEDEVRAFARRMRIELAKEELHRMSEEAVAAGDYDTGAKWLELALSLDFNS